MTSTAEALAMVAAERGRQQTLLADGTLRYTTTSPDCPDLLRLAALGEEFGEVGRCFCDGEPPERIREELVQLAAVAVGWVEWLSGEGQLSLLEPPAPEPEDDPWEDGESDRPGPIPYNVIPF